MLSFSSSQSLSLVNYFSLIREWGGRNEWRGTQEGVWKRSPMWSPKCPCELTLCFQWITTFVSQKLDYFLAHNTEEETMDVSKDRWRCNILIFWSGYSPFHDAGTPLNHSPGNVIHWPLVFNFPGEVSPESTVHFELTQPNIKYSGSVHVRRVLLVLESK